MSSDAASSTSRLPGGTKSGSASQTHLEQLDLFYGEASPNLARVYARVSGLAGGGELTLSGTVRGPECEYCKTIPITFPLADVGPGETLLAQALVRDPCFWSPDVPSRYQVYLELRRGGSVIESVEREFAFRNFGCRGKNFFLDGRRWVLRGVGMQDIALDELPAWRETGTALVIFRPSEELCREASRIGVMVVAWLGMEKSSGMQLAEVRRLAKHGAISMLLTSPTNPIETLRRVAPNLIFGFDVRMDLTTFMERPSSYKFPGPEFAYVQVHKRPERFVRLIQNCVQPVVAWRPKRHDLPLLEARAACDTLQRDLAPFGDYAGYVV